MTIIIYIVKKIANINGLKITLSDDLYKVIGIDHKTNLDLEHLTTSQINTTTILTQNVDNISDLLSIDSDQIGYINCNTINLNSNIKNELNINNDYLIINWQNKISNILRLEYANINIDTLQILSRKIKNTQENSQNVDLFNNKSFTIDFNNENVLIILFNKFLSSGSKDVQFTTVHHPEIPIIRVSDIDTTGIQNVIKNDFSIGNSGMNYRKEDPNFSLINTNTNDNLNTDLDFKYLDSSNNLKNILN